MGCSGSKTAETHENTKSSPSFKAKAYSGPKHKVVYVLGGPGSGKGTQCAKLVTDFKFVHISTGDLLRSEVDNKGPLASYLKEVMNQGKLVSSELLVQLISNNFETYKEPTKFLLDGFPRNQSNVDAWNAQFKDKIDISFLLYLQCSAEIMTKRLLERGKSSGRFDDNEETVKKRLKTFVDETEPVVKNFEKQHNNVERVNSEKNVDEVLADLKEIIQKRGLHN
jgi:UMP-CMP kinase family protein